MGHTILVDFDTFEKDVLRVEQSWGEDLDLKGPIDHAKWTFQRLFRDASPTEDAIAKTFIDMLNAKDHIGLLKKHSAAFTGNKSSSDGCTAKVDAGIYPQEHTPTEGNPDWTHIRLFIEFKRQGTSLDPFDDDDSSAPEADAQSRTAVRNQILDYARVVHEYQHRICIFGLFVIGPEFRLMRFDHSGIIVTKKENYAQNPRLLLSFLAWFDSLSDEEQGLDPTATLLKKGSRAYRLMDAFAEKNDSDMSHDEGAPVDATPTPYDVSTPPPKPDVPARNTRQQTKAVAAISTMDESYLDAVEPVSGDPRVFRYVRDQFRESLEHDWPRYKLVVGQGEEKRIFLVGKPVWTAFWLFGRGTRGYVALDVKTRRFMFLKDCWRPFYEGVEPEGCYLELLNEDAAKDPRIRVPTVIAHGDVAEQVTFTARYALDCAAAGKVDGQEPRIKASPATAPVATAVDSGTGGDSQQSTDAETLDGPRDDDTDYRLYTHYRIVFKDVCLPFTSVKSSKQLVSCLYNCITTHSLAYSNQRLLHRDISAGNMIIRPTLSSSLDANGMRTVVWHGILTDWELAKKLPPPGESGADKPKEVPRQPERTGTWQFMSVAYVRHHPYHPVSVADELESFFHVLLFYAIRLLRHNIDNARFFISEYFDSYTVGEQSRRRCSRAKRAAMRDGEIEVDDKQLQFMCEDGRVHEALNGLFATLLSYFKARYAVLKWQAIQAQEKASKSAAAPTPAPVNTGATDFDEPPPLEDETDTLLGKRQHEPSPTDIALAAQLDSHVRFLNIIGKAIHPQGKLYWPVKDAVADRLPENYDPRKLILALNEMCTASGMATVDEDPERVPPRKKARTEASEPAELFKAPQPAISRTGGIVSEPSGRARHTRAKGKGKARARGSRS
ncbi:hypothetical protein PYCCODRAFT_412716 [Trametes coccinea BRFM310]|uniref:Fungal-type protein kinase domain-containing protein n=1 Tax=Trametes coccinea (strain BRFM310) TaxID=1353009 RepID=A0A1Y2IM89_TRAC3|nr:hypothetical protein PYCCODRAFT_412716 [Trametes coccinea BRFM310]